MAKAMTDQSAKRRALSIEAASGESHEAAFARTAFRPTVRAAVTAMQFQPSGMTDLSLNDLVDELGRQCESASANDLKRCEAMLLSQAHTLDAIFNSLAVKAAANMGEFLGATDTYMRLALRAQAQCRTTLEALAAIKNPPMVFAKQANIAHGHQQVNNGTAANPHESRAHAEQIDNPPNELLEAQHGERMDAGTPASAIGSDPPLEAVGAVDRPTKRRGKG